MKPSSPPADPRIGPYRRRWVAAASVALLLIGGWVTHLSWGVWGVFVTCSVLTLAGACAPAFLLLPRSKAAWPLLMRLGLSFLMLVLAGWGLVALLNPVYVIGWWMPDKYSNVDEIQDEADALWVGVAALGMGLLLCVALVSSAFHSYSKDLRGESQSTRISLDPASRNPIVRNAGQQRPVSRRLRRARERQARRR